MSISGETVLPLWWSCSIAVLCCPRYYSPAECRKSTLFIPWNTSKPFVNSLPSCRRYFSVSGYLPLIRRFSINAQTDTAINRLCKLVLTIKLCEQKSRQRNALTALSLWFLITKHGLCNHPKLTTYTWLMPQAP